jgi:hypothetical protein
MTRFFYQTYFIAVPFIMNQFSIGQTDSFEFLKIDILIHKF